MIDSFATSPVFPQLLDFSFFAPLLLRVTVGGVLLFTSLEVKRGPYSWSFVFYIILGLLICVGLYTQVSALISILILAINFFINKKSNDLRENGFLYAISIVILLSLLITGPGAVAFDLPL